MMRSELSQADDEAAALAFGAGVRLSLLEYLNRENRNITEWPLAPWLSSYTGHDHDVSALAVRESLQMGHITVRDNMAAITDRGRAEVIKIKTFLARQDYYCAQCAHRGIKTRLDEALRCPLHHAAHLR